MDGVANGAILHRIGDLLKLKNIYNKNPPKTENYGESHSGTGLE